LLIAVSAIAGTAAYAASPSPGFPSAIGDENVLGFAVSPAYLKTGLVLALSAQRHQCFDKCVHQWASRDGGASWAHPKASGWSFGGRMVMTVDGNGRETIFNRGKSELERSDDLGETWTKVGPVGNPTPFPTYAADGAVAVAAGASDYVLRAGAVQTVAGSAGAIDDRLFVFSPAYPDSSKYPAALLVGADKRTGRPVIQQCKADFSCTGNTILRGTGAMTTPPALFPSVDYALDGVVFAQAGTVIYKSTDGGVTFSPLEVANNGASATAFPMMAVDPRYKEAGPVRTAYAAAFQEFEKQLPSGGKLDYNKGGIYRTTDGGTHWGKVGSPSPFDYGAIAVGVAPDGRLFGGYAHGYVGGLLCSSDGGETWKPFCPPLGAPSGKPMKIKQSRSVDSLLIVLAVLGGLAVMVTAGLFIRRRILQMQERGKTQGAARQAWNSVE
jgi:photosystem II stability/assembly factor-like uncharacterized protein